MMAEHPSHSGPVVTLDDGIDWTPLDLFTWVAYRERRVHCGSLESIQFPRNEWSCDWLNWPPGNLASALDEIVTGVPCVHPEGSHEEAWAASDRAWAHKVVALNGGIALELAKVLAIDLQRFYLARMKYENAQHQVHGALRAGRLQVWARRSLAKHHPDRNAEHELLDANVFTLQPRAVDESGWVGIARGDDGPWWDEARFKPDQVLALWPAGEGTGNYCGEAAPFPDGSHISPWIATAWRAFTTVDAPGHITKNRSFDHGAQRLPEETEAECSTRQDQHRKFDAAEQEVMNLLASRRVKAVGLPPVAPASPHPARSHVDVPANTFLSQQIAFSPGGELITRLPMLDRLFPPLDIRGSEASPEYPLWHDLLIEAAGLREVWGIVQADTAPEPGSIQKIKATVAGVNRLQAWLENEMRASPHASPGKQKMQVLARANEHVFSGPGFNSAWAAAIRATGAVAWSKAGAKLKSKRA